jgi:hypothetical protein
MRRPFHSPRGSTSWTKNHDGQLTPDEYGSDAFLHGIGVYTGNRDLIVTKERWDFTQREIVGLNSLIAIRIEHDPMRARELWRYDKNFTGVIPSPLVYQVLRAGGDWEPLAVNDLGEGLYATPALSGGRIYVRGGETLYCFVSGGK